MKTKIYCIIALSILAVTASACSFSFSTAKLSAINFGKNDKATPPTTTFDVGEKIYAVTEVQNSVSTQKVRFKLTFDNVQGKGKGETATTKDLDLDGSGSVNFFFTAPLPGTYGLEVSLLDDKGKELDKKSGTVTVKGGAAPPPANPASDSKSDEDHESDDKAH